MTLASATFDRAGRVLDVAEYEFQRLHGMGEALYEALLADVRTATVEVEFTREVEAE